MPLPDIITDQAWFKSGSTSPALKVHVAVFVCWDLGKQLFSCQTGYVTAKVLQRGLESTPVRPGRVDPSLDWIKLTLVLGMKRVTQGLKLCVPFLFFFGQGRDFLPSFPFYLGELLFDLPNFLFVFQPLGLVLFPVGFKFPLPDKFELHLLTGSKGPLKMSLLLLLSP